ncbi:MAG: ABC transporter permease [Gammaproteobacteria bacterium]|nr:ABC transporter permease [Gammaproteobacteria bacterium]MCP4089591.1 ABC transporter permease [Gammaproteobacteria bacterium]MCP4278074.1 ABC transporter permease [Gammaproteobacteria bacterium]MCP4832482.1 ABC transporter permease [Gammaproteobacteria bacterium]MCP4930174.1 ABC transporter permease [Gammaproteobacteria bacterium]
MFIAFRDLKFAKGRFLLMALVVALVAFLTTLLSGLAAGLIKNNISGLVELDVTHLAFEYNNKPSYRNSMIDREMWEGWRNADGVLAAEPLGHTMFNARMIDNSSLDDVVLWGIEPGSFLEPVASQGEALGRVENGVIISKLLVDRGLKIGDTFILDRVLTELTVVGIVDEFNIGHVPIVYTPIRKWQEATYGPPGGPPPGEKLPDILFDYATLVALKLESGLAVTEIENTDIDFGTLTIDKAAAYEASSGYKEELATVNMIQSFLIIISAVVIGAFFTVWTIQRTREIGLVKALGGSNTYLLRDALGQAVILMLLATLFGTGGALWLGQRFIESGNPFVLDPQTVFSSSSFLVIAGLLGSAISVRLITRIDPIIALGTER